MEQVALGEARAVRGRDGGLVVVMAAGNYLSLMDVQGNVSMRTVSAGNEALYYQMIHQIDRIGDETQAERKRRRTGPNSTG